MRLAQIWFRFLYAALRFLRFSEIRVCGHAPEASVPTLYLGLHRNGAIDGAVYLAAVPAARLTMSSQLRRSFIGKLIFSGIEFTRSKDKASCAGGPSNQEAFAQCRQALAAGESLLFFPEGTSDLGPARLPVHPGVASLIAQALEDAPRLRIQAMAAHYENPTAFQSRVHVLLGTPVYAEKSQGMRRAQILAMVNRLFDEVAADFPCAEERRDAEACAYAAALGTSVCYPKALLAIARGSCPGWREAYRAHLRAAEAEKLRLFQGVAHFPLRLPLAYLAYWCALAPLSITGAALNAPALLAMRAAENRLADAPNTRALFGSLALFFSLALWVPAASVALAACFGAAGPAFYALASLGALKTLRRRQKLSCCLANLLRITPKTRSETLALRQRLIAQTESL